MSNTIKLKRGSGSDPSASDLVVGELAIRTDSGKIFTKKDNGSVAEISGGGGIDDGDKGDITISNGGDTFTIDNGVVSTDKIADDAITAAKIAANAVGSSEIATDAVGSAEIAANAVTSAHIAANTITAGDIATDAVGSAEIAANAVQSAHIANGTIVNADISGSAAIAGSKISPAFTSDITGTGNLALTSTNANSSAGPEIDLFRNSPSPADADYLGQIKFRGENSVGGVLNYAKISAKIDDTSSTTEDGILEFMLRKAGSNNIAARFTSTDLKLINGTGLEVAGNISCDGTVDGVDIATRDTLFGGLTSSSGVLSNGVTATTQSAGNNTTRVATTAFVTTAISNLINGAPGSLDTLNELAAAMNDDAAFSTTVTNSLATKMPLAGGQFTGNITFSGSQTVDGRDLSVDGAKLDTIESNATADQTASEILTLIKTVDGAGSGLDADTLDGISSASFVRSDASDNLSGNTYDFSSTATNEKIRLSGTSSPYIRFREGTSNKAFIQWHSDGYFRLQNQESGATLRIKDDLDFTSDGGSTFNSIFHEGNLTVGDGGLTQNNFTDALKSKLDGIAASATNVTNNNQLTNGAGYITATLTNEQVQDIVGGMVSSNTESGITVTYQDSDGTLDFSVASQTDNNFTNADHSKLDGIESGATADQTASEILTLIKTVDGSGSGLDADLLDGYNQSSSAGNNTIVRRNGSGYVFANYFNTTANDVTTNIVTSIMVESNNDNYIRHGKAGAIRSFLNVEDGATADQSASEILTLIKTVDGTTSGLDADTLDGVEGASFLRSDADDTMNNTLTIGTGSGNSRLLIKKADNNVSDHIQFYNGTTRVGEIGCEDNTWLRINQETNKNIYTPRYIRADNGFFVDGTSKGINGSGNFIGGTIAGASDYSTLLRSNAADTATGVITFSGGGGAVTIGGNSDIRLSNGTWTGNAYGKIQQHSNALYIGGGSSSDYSFILRYNANDRVYIKSNGTIWPTNDSSSDIGTNSNRWANIYADNLYGSGANITAINASNISSGTIGSARIADDAITTAKIADGAVNTDRLAGSAVNSTRLADNAVTTSKITNNSVTNAKINSMAASKLTGALPAIDGSALTGISAGATGGGSDECFYENDQNVTTDYTITNGKNAMAAGPLTINSGVTVTVGSGETLTIV